MTLDGRHFSEARVDSRRGVCILLVSALVFRLGLLPLLPAEEGVMTVVGTGELYVGTVRAVNCGIVMIDGASRQMRVHVLALASAAAVFQIERLSTDGAHL